MLNSTIDTGLGRVFVTTDAGQTWTNITNNLADIPAWSLAIDPRTGTLYLGNDNGVWTLPDYNPATNTPSVWTPFGTGLPAVQVSHIDLNLNLNTLTVATYGRGIFQIYLDSPQANSGPSSPRAARRAGPARSASPARRPSPLTAARCCKTAPPSPRSTSSASSAT